MSKFIKRVGTKSKQFAVSLELRELTLSASYDNPGPIRVIWTRGAKVARSKWVQVEVDKREESTSTVKFTETLKLVTTMFYHDDSAPHSKKSKIEIIAQGGGKNKKAPIRIGKYSFDLSTYVKREDKPNSNVTFSLCFNKKWKNCIALAVKISCEVVRELQLKEKAKSAPNPKTLPSSTPSSQSSHPGTPPTDASNSSNPFKLASSNPFATAASSNPFLSGAPKKSTSPPSLAPPSNPFATGLRDREESRDLSVSRDNMSATGSEFGGYWSEMEESKDDDDTAPVVKGRTKEEQDKISGLVDHYERQLEKLRQQVRTLKEKNQDQVEYSSRLEVELVNAKVALCNQVDEYSELELKFQQVTQGLVKSQDNLFT